MKSLRGYIKVFIYVFILLIFIQLFRMDIIFSTDSIENILTNEFNIDESIKLTPTDKEGYTENNFLIIYNEKSQKIDNFTITLDYLKVKYDVMNSSDINKEYSKYNTIMMLESDISNVADIDKIMRSVSNGGKLVYIIDYELNQSETLNKYAMDLGIVNIGESSHTNYVYFNSEILSGIYGELNLDEFGDMNYNEFTFVELEVTDDSTVHMESEDDNPLIWSKEYNEGEIMVLNMGNYESKEFRGFLTGSISLLGEFFIYPIINAEVIFLDDFPADYNATPEILQENYGKNTERFILDIWWPNMVKLINKYDLIYTGAYIETYNNIVREPFVNNEYILSATKQLTSDLLKYKGEISFHGYNHQSLLYNQSYSDIYGYKAWNNGTDIINAINTTTNYFKKVYPNYKFMTYVPPSNLLDYEAIPSLLQAIPSIQTISGVYYPSVNEDGKIQEGVFTQEFGIDKRYGVSLPRISSGAFYTENIRYNIACALTSNGIINHFVHPDDVQDPLRSNGLLWEELYLENDNLFGSINQYYGWLDKTKASDAAEKVKQYISTDIIYLEEDEKITIKVDNFHNEVSLILATYKEIVSSEDCEYEKIDSFRYLIKMKKNTAVIEVE